MSTLEEKVRKIFEDKLHLQLPLQIQKLFGHASYRTYYRITPKDGKTYILMQMPEGLSSVSEEITNYEGPQDELPFLNVQRYLASLKLPVPQVLAHDDTQKMIILEDVGDRHLESYVKEAKEAMRLSFYRRAITLLVKMQKKTSESILKSPPSPFAKGAPGAICIAFHRSFDEKLLNWEFDHFLEYGIEDRFKIKVPNEEKKVFAEWTRKISKEIAESPFVFVHRDFQSRNLMIKNYEFYLLDFQDALLGPQTYDLVSLTRDSYVELKPESIEKLIQHFLELRKKEGIPIEDETRFRKLYHQTTLQRKLKDTGRFQFINSVKENPSFLVNVPSSLRYVKNAFEKLPEFESLRKMIGKYVPELQ